MNSLFYLFSFLLFPRQILARDQFVIKHFATPANHDDLTNRKVMFIRYLIRIPDKFVRNIPIFYGIGNQETIEETRSRFGLFERTSSYFLNAITVYVEQRYFGNSTLFKNEPINSIEDLKELTLGDTVFDNVLLIKKLAKQFKTFNFLIFGVGHGALIAGHVSNTFSNDPELEKFKVLAWTSSTPLKFMRHGLYRDFDFQLISVQFKTLLNNVGCSDTDISYFGNFYDRLRALKQNKNGSNNEILEKLNLDPIPNATMINGVKPNLLEFVIFIRNGIRELAYKNVQFDELGNKIKNEDKVLKKLCDAMTSVPIDQSITTKQIEDILILILPNYRPKSSSVEKSSPSFWRINPKAGPKLNRQALLTAYQQCTNWQLVTCPDDYDSSDPFASSSYSDEVYCEQLSDFDNFLYTECQGLFDKELIPELFLLDLKKYPIILTKNVITTMNTGSIYFGSYKYFQNMEDTPTKFTHFDKLNGIDSQEMESIKNCDSDKMNDVRYLVLRGFACYANLIKNSSEICDYKRLFNDGIYKDVQNGDNCSINDSINFPFGHEKINFVNLHHQIVNYGLDVIKNDDNLGVEIQSNNSFKNNQKLPVFVIILFFVLRII